MKRIKDFNSRYPIGTRLCYSSATRTLDTRTRSEAWRLKDGSAVVMVDGITGCVSLDNLAIYKDQ